MDSVPSHQGTMIGTNSVGPSVVCLDHFPIDPGFAAMTGFGICITPNLDWFVLYTRLFVVVCFAVILRMSSFTMSKLILSGAKR